MFENVDGRTDGRRTTDAGVTGILIAHLRAFGSGELKSGTSKKIQWDFQISKVGSLDFLDLKVNGSPVAEHFISFSQ